MLATRTAPGKPTNVLALDPQTDHPTGDEADEHDQEQREGLEQRGEDDQEESGPDEDEQGQEMAAGGGGAGVPLLRFSRPRDPAVIARWLRTRVIRPDSEIWLRGYEALREWVARYGDACVPTGAVIDLPDREEDYAVGPWVSEQRRALAGGMLRPHRYQLLDELGMIWDIADARFKNGLVAARTYVEEYGTLAAPRDAVIDGFPIGQWLENLRKGATVVTERRDSALREIDEYWNPGWPVSWQRRFAALADLLQGEAGVPDVPAGVRVNGVDVGTWLQRQASPAGWAQLTDGQRALLEQLGVRAPETDTGPEAGSGQAPVCVPCLEQMDSFGRGIAAARQYLAREGHLTVPRKHEEILYPAGPGGTPNLNRAVAVKLGVFLSNHKTRRARLTHARRQALTDLGLHWATQ